MRVLIVGDIHGQFYELLQFITEMKSLFRIQAAIQLGDFGFFPELFESMEEQDQYFPVPLYVIDGNHEDHEWLYLSSLNNEMETWKQKHNIYFLQRATVLNLGGAKIGAIGGALHVDQPQQFSAKYKTSNYIQKAECESAIDLFNLEKPELIISHTCPTGIGIGIKGNEHFDHSIVQFIVNEGFDPGASDDCGDRQLTHLWDSLKYKPKAWAFGHFHVDHVKKIDETLFVCNDFSKRKVNSQIVVWDTEEKSILTLKF